jgi:hypothetical protein
MKSYITSAELLGQFHLETLRGGNDNVAATILTKHLGKPNQKSVLLKIIQISEGVTHTSPVGPAPNIRTDEPSLGAIFSRPWAAHEAGSRRVASISLRL